MTTQSPIKNFALRFLPDRMLQRLKKVHYARSLRNASDNAEPDLKVLKFLVPEGASVVDIGANFGLYSRFLSELVGPTGHVWSIEPVPLTWEVLQSNVRKLALKNVEALNMAISSTCGEVCMEIPRYASGGENFYEARVIDQPQESSRRNVRIASRTLDSLFGHLRQIDFIKCDVEGHERAVLLGAVELLRKSKPAWLMEINGDPDHEGSDAEAVFQVLAESGYSPFWFDGRRLRPREAGEKSVNYFFLTARHLRKIPAVVPL